MTKTKSTKRALVSSALALILCVSMLVGSTYAWFTDSVTSAGNTIQSGTLKVDLIDADGNSMEGQVIEFVDQDDNALWEPGCTYETEPVYVVNKGNLALKYQIVINGINGNAKLLEAIDWTVTIGGTETDLEMFEGTLIPGQTETSGAIVLTGHMKEEAGNEYQGLTVDGISIGVFATQFTSEFDSFNDQYDVQATYLNRDADGAWLINNINELYYFAADVNSGNTYSGETVKLAADIDLAGYNWTPIGQPGPSGTTDFSTSFRGTFDGQEYTVSNVKVNKDGWAGLFGLAHKATIKNVTVKGAKLNSSRMTGSVVGQLYGSLENCHVVDADIVLVPNEVDGGYDNGDKIGGIVGWLGDNGNNHYIKGCTAKNVTLKAYRDVGGVAGYIASSTTVENCAVDTVSITVDQATNYYGDKDANAGAIVGRIYKQPVTIQNNTEANVTIKTIVAADDVASLTAAIAQGGNVALVADIDMGSTKLTVAKDLVFDLNGHTVGGSCEGNQSYLFMVNNGATMDIKDSSAAQTGKITYAQGTSNIGWAIDLEGQLNLYSGTIELTGDSWSIAYAVDVRPNAWGTNYAEDTVFTMYGGKIVSSFDGIRVASSSSDSYPNIVAKFVMNGGEIDAARDGIFMQQSNVAYDTLTVEINDGVVKGTRPIRVYGSDATSVNAGTAKPMTITAKAASLVLVGELDTAYTWHTEGKIAYRGMSLENLNQYSTITLN